jgi:hypothetical protein
VVGKPKEAVPVKYAEPFRSTAIADALIIPPICPQYMRVESEELSFAMNISGLPMEFWANAPGVVGKSNVPVPTLMSIIPVTYRLPLPSLAIPVALSADVPPSSVELTRPEPDEFNTVTKASSFPFGVVE